MENAAADDPNRTANGKLHVLVQRLNCIRIDCMLDVNQSSVNRLGPELRIELGRRIWARARAGAEAKARAGTGIT